MKWLEKHGIYSFEVSLDWRINCWWPPYGKFFYDQWWHGLHIGPICFNWNT